MRVPPTPPPAPASEPPRRRFAPRVALVVVAVVVVVLLASARQVAVFFTDKLWFDDLSLGRTWRTLIVARIIPALVFTTAMFVLLLVSLVVADRLAPRFRNMGPEDELVERYRTFVAPYAGRVRVLVALVFAVFVGAGASSQWKAWILYRNRVRWGVKDPQFGKDIGFYVFELPFLRFVFEWLFVVLLVVLLVTAVFHYLNGGIRFQAPYQRVTPQVKAHLSVILASMAITKTVQYWLGRYELVFSQRSSVIDGAAYTDVKAQLPALQFLALISVVAAILFVVNIWQRGWTLPAIAVGLWAFISIVLGTAYPAYVQNFQVKPNERARESKYIARNIAATRAAFGLDKVTVRPYTYDKGVTRTVIDEPGNRVTIDNLRLWDPGTVIDAFKAGQEFVSFYSFAGADVDRYRIGDQNGRQVLVAARDLDLAGLPNDTWTNRHLVYTHGLGAAAAVANQSDADLPSYALRNIPAQGTDLRITRPEIYFGDQVGDYAVVGTKENEIQLKSGSGARRPVRYRGKRGVQVSSPLRRAAFAMRFSDLNLMLSSRLTDSSRLLYVRDVRERVAKAAPFLRFDNNPYLVVRADGSLTWVIDAYTATSRYPYSQQVGGSDVDTTTGLGTGFNYVRNSVKATVDAYDGTVRFYAIDERDPLLRAYRKAFPDLFTDVSQVPNDLAPHFRYPEQLFKVQARVFELYHITNPDDFFSGLGAWAVSPQPSNEPPTTAVSSSTPAATAAGDGGRRSRIRDARSRIAPLYQRLRLPGTTSEEMVLTIPYVPVSRDGARDNNLTSFLVARNDGFSARGPGRYGQLVAYDVPDGAPSPVQAARQIEQETDISEQFSLLRRGGSNVVLGDVQLLPVGGSILYARAVYTQTEDARSFPRLKFVALTYLNKAVLGCVSTGEAAGGAGGAGPAQGTAGATACTASSPLDDALAKLFGGVSPPPPVDTPPQTAEQALQAIDDAFQAYLQATARGDLAEAGRQLAKVRQLLADALGNGSGTGGGSAAGGTTTTTTGTPRTTPTTTPPTTVGST